MGVNVNKKWCINACAILVIILIATTAAGCTTTQTTANIPGATLTIVGSDSTEVVLDGNEIAALQSFESEGGLITSVGAISGVDTYTGVTLDTLLELVGGAGEGNSVRVTAADDYAMVITYEQMQGDFLTFDPVTGNEVDATGELTPLIVYHINGGLLSTGDGPLRLVIVGSEGLITEGHFWIKQVVKIEGLAAVQEWELNLTGAITDVMDRATFESGTNCHGVNWTDDRDRTWEGIPLYLLVGMVDDDNVHEQGAFNRALADTNYTIRVVAFDGYSVDIDSLRVKLNDDIFLANVQDGGVLEEKYWPLRLVGSGLDGSEMLRNVAGIQLLFNG